MRFLLRRFSFLIYFLILHFCGFSLPVMAKVKGKDIEKSAKTSIPEPKAPYFNPIPNLTTQASDDSKVKQPDRLKIAVVEMHDAKLKPEIIEKVTDTIREELTLRDRFQVLSKESTQSYFKNNPNFAQKEIFSNQLNRYIEQAKEFYLNFSFKEATHLLENTIYTYREAKTPLTDAFSLTEAYVELGNIYVGSNNEKKAMETFQEAVRLNPELQITEAKYPPKTVKTFQSAREEFLKKAGYASLEINSPTAANVSINGVAHGQTPLKIDRFTTGEHFILLTQAGYKPQALKLQVGAEGIQQKVDLESTVASSSQVSSGISLPTLSDVNEQVRRATIAGKALGVSKVVLVSVQEVGWNNRVNARMIDVGYQASHKPTPVDVLDLPKDTQAAAKLIANNLVEIADYDLAKDPKKYADSEVLVVGQKRKKSILKSPLLWSLVGVVVAGGAASALLIGGSDNSSSNQIGGALPKGASK